ncbi:hypothetical protein HS088_TW09G00818 [Tripterygium wilfordii]|uniref:Signal recognition particle 14 kDa protein n=1 Tax=Tripterygium wilfordii TaxID=458696 RepID=A0A7J7D8Y7_TRIWF|nr:hypothetical protein HS088_TW09G00818 [Tripterygium wilfordii]
MMILYLEAGVCSSQGVAKLFVLTGKETTTTELVRKGDDNNKMNFSHGASASLKSKVKRNKTATAGEPIEYRCLVRATDGKKTISTSVGAKDHLRFQSSYATILKAHMTSLKKKERKDKKKTLDADKKDAASKKPKRV